MSQTTFLESVVSWDHQKCQQNLDEALPRLFSCLQSSEIIQEQVGILKIICQLFLPCIQIEHTEDKLFRHIVGRACLSFDTILDDIKQINKDQDVTGEVLSLLELMSDILDCYEVCVKYVGSTDRPLAWNKAQSLPIAAVHILKGTYGHCKDSNELYGELLAHLSEPLSALFRKAHSLQLVFLNLLDKLTIDGAVTDKDVHNICTVCYGLFEVCQIVTSLDVKLVVTLWKAISKHAVQKKDLLKNDLNVDEMIKYLSSEISNGYTYLFQLLPHVDEEGMILSQGDEKGFQKSVKILGFQMKIMVSLVREYSDYLSECGSDVCKLLLYIQRMMPPCINRQRIEDRHSDEIQRQLLNATEPLVSCLLTNMKFLQCMTGCSSVDQLIPADSLPHLLLTKTVMDSVPKLQEEDQDKWLSPSNHPEDVSRYGLIQSTFSIMEKCSLELCLPVYVPGLSATSKTHRQVCLYDEVCVHFCGFIGSLPAKSFHILEEVLLQNVLVTSPLCSQFAADVWCFLVRYGTADLCYSHVKLLLEVMSSLQGSGIQYRNVAVLVNRIIKFLAKEHQMDIIKLYPPTSHMIMWSALSISGFTSTNARHLVETIVSHSIKVIHNFINTSVKKGGSFVDLISALDCLLNIYATEEIVEKYVLPDVQSTVVDKIKKLCNSVSDWMIMPVTKLCFSKVIHLCCFTVQNLNNKELLQILVLISSMIKQPIDQHLCLSLAKFLQHVGRVKLSPSSEQSQILDKIPEIYNCLLSNEDPVVQHSTLESFTKFAEVTIHESIVPQCIQDNNSIQDCVVAFLNKTPIPSNVKRREYLDNMLQGIHTEDTEEHEPSSKRPRTDNSVQSLDNQQTLVDVLTLCTKGLQRNEKPLQPILINNLKTARDMISELLHENG